MKLFPDKMVLGAKVVESRMTKGAHYIEDERGYQDYPGMLQAYCLDWKPGDELLITIERAKRKEQTCANQTETNSSRPS